MLCATVSHLEWCYILIQCDLIIHFSFSCGSDFLHTIRHTASKKLTHKVHTVHFIKLPFHTFPISGLHTFDAAGQFWNTEHVMVCMFERSTSTASRRTRRQATVVGKGPSRISYISHVHVQRTKHERVRFIRYNSI